MANKDVLKITFDADSKEFEQNLLASMGNISDAASKKLAEAFDKAGKNQKLKKQLTGVYQSLFDEFMDAAGDLDAVNAAVDRFAGKIDYINTVVRKSKIKGLFDNLNVGEVNELLKKYDAIIVKEKEIAKVTSDEFRDDINAKTTIKSLKSLEKTYGDVEKSQKKYESQLSEYVKSAGIEVSIISKEVKEYSSLIALFEKINNTKVENNSEDAIKKAQSLLYVMQKIYEYEDGNKLFSNFRNNELKNVEKITDSVAVIEQSVHQSISKFVKSIVDPLKTEISNIYQEVINSAVKKAKHQGISDARTQEKLDDYGENSTKKSNNSNNTKADHLEQKYDNHDNVLKKYFDTANKSAEELENTFYDIGDQLEKLDKKYENGDLFGNDLKEYILLYKQLEDLSTKIDGFAIPKQYTELFNVLVETNKDLSIYAKKIDEIKNNSFVGNNENNSLNAGNVDSSEVKELRDEMKELKEDVSSLKNRVDTLEDTTAFDSLSSSVNEFDKRIENAEGSVENLTNSFKLLSELSLTDLQKAILPLFNGINQFYNEKDGKHVSEYWNKLQDGIEGSNVEIIELLKLVGLFDSKTGKLKIISDGMENSGGIIGDDKVLIARKNKRNQFENKNALKTKLEEAYQAGINVARILDIIGTKDSKVFFDIQEKAPGNILSNPYGQNDTDFINIDWFEATDDQIKKLISDLIVLQKLGINVESNLTNIMFDSQKGFTLIDMDLGLTQYENDTELMEEHIMRMFSGLEEYYEDRHDEANLAIVAKARSRFDDLSKQVIQSYAEAQDSHSPSKEFEKLENDAVDGIVEGANKNEGRLKNVGRQMADSVKDGFKEIFDRNEIIPEDFVSEGQITLLEPIIGGQQELQAETQETQQEFKTLKELIEEAASLYNKLERNPIDPSLYYDFDYDETLPERYVGDYNHQNYANTFDDAENRIKTVYSLYSKVKSAFDKGNDIDGVVKINGEAFDSRDLEDIKEALRTLIIEYVQLGGTIDTLPGRYSKAFKETAKDIEANTLAAEKNEEQFKENAKRLQEINASVLDRYNALRNEILKQIGGEQSILGNEEILPYVSDFDNYDLKDIDTAEEIYKQAQTIINANKKEIASNEAVVESEKEKLKHRINSYTRGPQLAQHEVSSIVDNNNDIIQSNERVINSEEKKDIETNNNSSASPLRGSFDDEEQVVDDVVDSEKSKLSELERSIKAVIERVNDKTYAFIDEEQIVDKVVEKETEKLSNLSSILTEISGKVESISKLNINIGQPGDGTTDANGDSSGSGEKELTEEEKRVEKVANAYKSLTNEITTYITLKDKEINGKLGTGGTKSALKEVDNLKKLDAKIQDAVNGQNAYENATGKAAKAQQKFNDQLDNYSKIYSENYLKKINLSLDNAVDEDNKSTSYTDRVSEIRNKIEELEKILPIKFTDDNSVKNVQELGSEIHKLIASLKGSEFKPVDPIQIDNLSTKMSKFYNANTAAPAELRNKLKALMEEFERLAQSADGINDVDFNRIKSEFASLEKQIQKSGKTGISMTDKISKKFKDLAAYFVTYVGLQDAIQVVKQGYQYVAEIDKQMIELEKVSNMSDQRLAQSFERSTETAKDLGSTIADVVSATADWSRLGYNADEAEELAEVAIVYKNVGDGIDIAAANQSLISTLQGFQLDASEAMSIVDKFNEVANRMPIDSAGIGDALQRSAAAFNAANTDLSESIALITGANSVLQDTDKVGNMWRTVSARIRGASTELTELGEESDEYVESTSKLRDLVKGITGFDIMEDEKTFKSIYDIIVGIGEVYKDLEDIDQAALVEALAGKQQSNALVSALQNANLIKEAYEIAENSSGSAMKEQEKWEEGLEAKTNKLKASLEELATTIMDSGFLGKLINAGRIIIEILTAIIDKVGVLPTLIGAVWAVSGVKKSIKNDTSILSVFTNIIDGIKELKETYSDDQINQLAGLGIDEKDIRKASSGFVALAKNVSNATGIAGKAKVVWTALTTAISNHPYVAIAAGIGVAIAAVVGLVDWLTTTAEEAQETYKEFQELESEIASLNNELSTTNKRIDELNAKENLSLVEAEELEKQKEINKELEQEIRNRQIIAKQKAEEANDDAVSYFEQGDKISDVEDKLNKIKEYEEYLNTHEKGTDIYSDDYRVYSFYERELDALMNSSIPDLIKDFMATDDGLISGMDNGLLEKLSGLYDYYFSIFDPAQYYTDTIENTFSQETFKGVKDLLVALAKEGNLSGDVLTSKFGEFTTQLINAYVPLEKIIEYIKWLANPDTIDYDETLNQLITELGYNSDSISEKGRAKNELRELGLELSYDEMVAYLTVKAKYSGETDEWKPKDWVDHIQTELNENKPEVEIEFLDVSETVDKLNNKLKPAMNSLKSAWEEIFGDPEDLESIKNELKELGQDGSVDLTNRPMVDSSTLEGWKEEGTSTVLTSTYSNADKTIAINFTPMVVDPDTGEYKYSLTPEKLQTYAEEVIAGVHDDYLNLQIGAKFEGTYAVEEAEAAAKRIHELHDKYYLDAGKLLSLSDIDFLSIADSIKSELDTLKEEYKIDVDTESYDNFVKVIRDSESTGWDVRNAFDAITESIIKATVTGTEDFGVLKAVLEDLGIKDSDLIALQALTDNTDALKAAGLDLKDATQEQIEKFVNERIETENVAEAIEFLTTKKILCNLKEVDTASDVQEFINLAEQVGVTGEVMEKLIDLKYIYEQINEEYLSENDLAALQEEASILVDQINEIIRKRTEYTPGNNGKDGSNGNKDKEDKVTTAFDEAHKKLKHKLAMDLISEQEYYDELEKLNNQYFKGKIGYEDQYNQYLEEIYEYRKNLYQKEVNWIEKSITKITAELDKLKNKANTTYLAWGTRNESLTAAMDKTAEAINAQQEAYDTYMQKAADVGLSQEYIDKIQNGSMDIELITDNRIKEKIEQYEDWYNKALDCADAVEELRGQLAELAKQRFDNITQFFDGIIQTTEDSIARLNITVDDDFVITTPELYQGLIDEEINKMNYLKQQAEQLKQALADAEANGVDKTSEDWRNMYNQIRQNTNAIMEQEAAVHALVKAQIELINTTAENQLNALNIRKDYLNNQIEKLELQGYVASSGMYKRLIKENESRMAILAQQKLNLEHALNSAVNNADPTKRLQVGSQAWHDMKLKIDEVTNSMMELELETLEYQKTLKELEWEKFDRIHSDISNITSETDFLKTLFENEDMYGEDGKLTDAGKTMVGLHAQNYVTYREQAEMYKEEIDKINAELANDPYNDTLIQRKNELTQASQDAISAAEDERLALIELAKEGYQAQIDSIKELIDAKKEQLQVDKSLYEYQKTIEEKTKNIASIQKQLAALSGDNSEENRAKIQKLQVDLEEAQKDLEETQYDKWYDDQTEMLDNLMEEYEELMNKEMEKNDANLQEMITVANENAGLINQTLKDTAGKLDYNINQDTDAIWHKDLNGIGNIVSTIPGTLENIEKYIKTMYANSMNLADIGVAENGGDTTITNPETARTFVTQMYQGLLGRDPEEAGFNYWTDRLTNGETVEEIIRGFIDSEEFKASNVDQNAFINGLYKGVLGRTADLAGFKFWKDKMNAEGLSYQDLANLFLESDEFLLPQTWLRMLEANPQDSLINAVNIGEDGFRVGTSNISEAQLSELQEVAYDLVDSQQQMLSDLRNRLPVLSTNNNQSSITVGDINLNLPNVSNYADFMRQAQSDPNFEKMVMAMTIGKITGTKSNMLKYNVNF